MPNPSTQVKQYKEGPNTGHEEDACCVEDVNGDYVLYTDHAAAIATLEQTLKAVLKENELLKQPHIYTDNSQVIATLQAQLDAVCRLQRSYYLVNAEEEICASKQACLDAGIGPQLGLGE